jgi:hypothetical protein
LIRFDSEKGRWDVSITNGQKDQVLALKPANLSLHETQKMTKAAVEKAAPEKAAARKAAADAKVVILANIRPCLCVQ